MSEDKGSDLSASTSRPYWSTFEGPHNPLNLKSVSQFASEVELTESPDGHKYVVKTGRFPPEVNARYSLTDFMNGEMQILEEFGVDHVNYNFLAMEDPNSKEPALKMVLDYVEGDEIKVAPWEMRKKVVKGLLSYYRRKISSEEDFILDIVKPHQYRYGSVNNGENKIYLVDIDLDQNSRIEEHVRRQREWRILSEIEKIFSFGNTREEQDEIASDVAEFLKPVDPETLPQSVDTGNAKAPYQRLLRATKSA